MPIEELAKCKVIVGSVDMTIFEIAKLMKDFNIGDVIIMGNKKEPIGIITDRDITIKIVANDVNPKEIVAADIMSTDMLILKNYQAVQESLEMMCAKGVRRAPIVNSENILVGVVSADDLALLISDEMSSYGKLIQKQLLCRRQK